MPVGSLNNAAIATVNFTDALTVVFAFTRPAFSVQVHNDAVYYKLAYIPADNPRGVTWEFTDHHTVPSLLTFNNPEDEGLPPGARFAGIQFRAAVTPAAITPRVTVQ